MSSDALAGGGTPANAASGSGNSENDDAAFNERINKILSARERRTEERLLGKFEQMLSALKPAQQSAPAEQQIADGEKLTLKQMNERIEAERKARVDLEKRLQEEQGRAKEARMRTELREKLASKIGADNPLLRMAVDSLYDAQKRVVDRDGVTMLKFIDAYGAEDYKPLDDGIKSLFDGELKAIVQQSRVGQLPSTGVARSAGAVPSRPQVADGAPAFNPGLYEILQKSRPDQAEAYKAAAQQAEADRPLKR